MHGAAGKRHNRSSVILINRDREPLVENNSRRQQQSVLALLRHRGLRRSSLSAVNSPECTLSWRSQTQPAKSDCGSRSTMLARKPAALSQLAKTANSQDLRTFLRVKGPVFSVLQLVAGLLLKSQREGSRGGPGRKSQFRSSRTRG